MPVSRMLFVGIYPNPVDPYRNVFFQNLIFSLADQGVECTVIMPLSVMHYRGKLDQIPEKAVDVTPQGNRVAVYYPRCLTFSSKQIGSWNTGRLSENKYFIMKNSWGSDRPYGGLDYIAFVHFREHTISVVMTKEAYQN